MDDTWSHPNLIPIPDELKPPKFKLPKCNNIYKNIYKNMTIYIPPCISPIKHEIKNVSVINSPTKKYFKNKKNQKKQNKNKQQQQEQQEQQEQEQEQQWNIVSTMMSFNN